MYCYVVEMYTEGGYEDDSGTSVMGVCTSAIETKQMIENAIKTYGEPMKENEYGEIPHYEVKIYPANKMNSIECIHYENKETFDKEIDDVLSYTHFNELWRTVLHNGEPDENIWVKDETSVPGTTDRMKLYYGDWTFTAYMSEGKRHFETQDEYINDSGYDFEKECITLNDCDKEHGPIYIPKISDKDIHKRLNELNRKEE